jgi:hypothetical protein
MAQECRLWWQGEQEGAQVGRRGSVQRGIVAALQTLLDSGVLHQASSTTLIAEPQASPNDSFGRCSAAANSLSFSLLRVLLHLRGPVIALCLSANPVSR